MDTPYAIEMLHITKRFPGIIANDDITLQVKKGEIHALLLECTDLSVFARTVQEAVSVPVYDINSLIAYAAFCVRRNQWV